MSQGAKVKANSSRAIALQRRKALSSGGKAAIKTAVPHSAASPAPTLTQSGTTGSGGSARAASLARRRAMSSQGKSAIVSQDRVRGEGQTTRPNLQAAKKAQGCGCGCGGKKAECTSDKTGKDSTANTGASNGAQQLRMPVVKRPQIAANTSKQAALLRRKSLSSLGKAGLNASAVTEAQVARASNPKISGRELAKVLRDQRSKNGAAGRKNNGHSGRLRKNTNGQVGAAQDAPWKVGASVTVSGQTVTGTMVGRQDNMTGDEPSTCRSITGSEYLGAEIFEKFCKSGAKASHARKKVSVTTTSHGNAVSGNRMGRASNVTGNEPGTCKRITGDEYISTEQSEFCGKPAMSSMKTVFSNRAPISQAMNNKSLMSNGASATSGKVGHSSTLRGGSLTGTMLGRGDRVTGDEPGSCRNVTGDDYIGQEQFRNYCNSTPQPKDSKVAVSQTLAGLKVTGDLAARSTKVTGDEPGTCQVLTGTPYSGGDQYREFCSSSKADAAQARMQPSARRWGKPMTGQQPGISGLTGAEKGVCDTVSGTPYVGSDQVAKVCASAGQPNAIDDSQGSFTASSPNPATQQGGPFSHVTGSRYESGHITGPFGMGDDKVTGTEQARFDRQKPMQATIPMAERINGRVKPRITGEGMEAGLKITGDDWDRGDRVTGTEGASATRRNPTLRGGPMSAVQMRPILERPEEVAEPVSKVTGGSGNTEKGALITYSGGARG